MGDVRKMEPVGTEGDCKEHQRKITMAVSVVDAELDLVYRPACFVVLMYRTGEKTATKVGKYP